MLSWRCEAKMRATTLSVGEIRANFDTESDWALLPCEYGIVNGRKLPSNCFQTL